MPSKIGFLGIGGIGMSALARYFHHKGIEVWGYDKTPTSLTDALHKEGIRVFYEDQLECCGDADWVIYTPAIPKDLGLYVHYSSQAHVRFLKRSEAIQEITKGKRVIAVAGSHGKTTITSLTAYLLTACQIPCTALLGGICRNFQSNFISTGEDWFVVEADEFDRSFHRLEPEIAIISAVDSDHLDVYGDLESIQQAFQVFIDKIRAGGLLIYHASIPSFLTQRSDIQKVKYSLSNTDLSVDISGEVTAIHPFGTQFNYKSVTTKISNLHQPMGGLHNAENALPALFVAEKLGADIQQLKNALAGFLGIARRFEKRIDHQGWVVIDDYAHHPNELKALMEGVRVLYPQQKVHLVFQPHLYSRTRDLAEAFGAALSLADEIYLTDIYPARELPIPGVQSEMLIEYISSEKEVQCLQIEQIERIMKAQSTGIWVIAGAGNIDQLAERLFHGWKNDSLTSLP